MSFVIPRLIWIAFNPLSILLALICLALLLQITPWRRSPVPWARISRSVPCASGQAASGGPSDTSEAAIRKIAISEGTSTLALSGIKNVLDGITTIDEVVRESVL